MGDKQTSKKSCTAGDSFGCINGTSKMWIQDGCRGEFTCNGNSGVSCDVRNMGEYVECTCAPEVGEVWVRRLTDGDLAVAMPNLGDKKANLTICFDTLRFSQTAQVRNIWEKKDLGVFSKTFTAEVD